jgi:hypothetical protein
MKQNEGTVDRVIRVLLGLTLIGFGWFYFGNNTLGIVLDVLGVVLLITGLTGFCLLYKLFGNFSTKQ